MVLAAPAAELVRLHVLLEREKIDHVVVVEDASPYLGQVMALGIAPLDGRAGRWLKHLPLLRAPP